MPTKARRQANSGGLPMRVGLRVYATRETVIGQGRAKRPSDNNNRFTPEI